MGFFDKIKAGLTKTRDALSSTWVLLNNDMSLRASVHTGVAISRLLCNVKGTNYGIF